MDDKEKDAYIERLEDMVLMAESYLDGEGIGPTHAMYNTTVEYILDKKNIKMTYTPYGAYVESYWSKIHEHLEPKYGDF